VNAKRLIGCLAALVLAAGGLWPLHVLGFRDLPGGRWRVTKVVAPGDAFALGYTHSVKQRPVWDYYTVDTGFRIIQTKTVFPGTGFGLPSEVGPGETHTLLPDGSDCIDGMHRPVPQLALRVERAYRNTLVFGDAAPIDLSDLAGDGVLDMRIHRSTPIQLTIHFLSAYGDDLWHGRSSSKSNS